MSERPWIDWLTRNRKSSLKLDTQPEPRDGKTTKIERIDMPDPALADHSGGAAPASCPDDVANKVAEEVTYSTLPAGVEVTLHHVVRETFDGPIDNVAPLGNLEHFAIQRWIGGGGQGSIYQAYDRKNDRLVAIKLLKSNAKAKELIANEAKRSSTNHPNLITSYDYRSTGKHEFLVLEYVAGETLQQRLAKEEIPVKQAVEWGRQIASGLTAMHARGIPHLDLKPHNIMIRQSDQSAVIIDVGLDRIAVAGGMHKALGNTPSYASPEQIGEEDLGVTSDIYSFGVLMYQLLTGRLPHKGQGETIKLEILHHLPPRPSTIKKGLDKTLDCILMKCLQKQPAERYESILQVGQDLRNWLEHYPTSVYPLSWFEWRRLWTKRHPVATITMLALSGIVTVSVLGIIFVWMYWYQARMTQQDLRVLVGKTLQMASTNRDMSPGLATMVANESRPYFEKVLDESSIIGQADDEVAEAQFNVAISLANMNDLAESQRFAAAANLLFSRLAKQRWHSANELRVLAVYETERVGLARLLGQELSLEECGQAYEQALAWSDTLVRRYGASPDALELLASAHTNYASHLFQCSQFADSIQQRSQAIELLTRIGPSSSTLRYRKASLEQDQAITYSFLGQLQQADEARQRAQDLFARLDDDEFLDVRFDHLLDQGSALANDGLIQPAKTWFREASTLSMFALSQAAPSQEFHWVASCLRALDWQAALEERLCEGYSVESTLATTEQLLEYIKTHRQPSDQDPYAYFQKMQLHGVRYRLKKLTTQPMLQDLETIIKGMPELYDTPVNQVFLAREYALSDRAEDALKLLAGIPKAGQGGELMFNMACVLSLAAQAQTTATPAISEDAAGQLAARAIALLGEDQTQETIKSIPEAALAQQLSTDLKWLVENHAAEVKKVLSTAGHTSPP